jgi:hypothetical protein
MAENICPQCGKEVGASEFFCPHCGGAQVPQYSRGQLAQALGREREGKTRLPVGIGCLVGLVVGILLAVLADQMGWLLPGGVVRFQQHAEIVMLLMIGGIIGGLLVGALRTKAEARRRASAATSVRDSLPEQPPSGDASGISEPHT